MTSFPNQEHRPLKRLRFGPIGPEVYPQDKKQKEDEISQNSVKHGFNNMPCIKDEFASAKDAMLNTAVVPVITKLTNTQVSTAFNALLAKKQELNTLQEQAKRKPQMNVKDNFYPIGIARGKHMSETWMRDDLATTKPLSLIAKKVPVFNKREDVFQKLCEENIPLYRAAWYIKLANTYNILICDVAKNKKRQVIDPCQDWTAAMTKHLGDQLMKMSEHYKNSAPSSSNSVVMNTSFLTAGGGNARQLQHNSDIGLEPFLRQWNYNCRLVLHLFDDGLLDKQDFLSWLIDQLESYCGGSRMTQQSNDAMLKILVVQVLKHINELINSQMLSRRMSHFCCKKLALMCSDSNCNHPTAAVMNESTKGQNNSNNQSAFNIQNSTNPGKTTTTTQVSSSSSGTNNNSDNNNVQLLSTFSECANCTQHRGLLMNLSAIVQAIVISCPGALVWHDLGEGKQFSTLNGSPLDFLPCSPSMLPMPSGSDNKEIREMLMISEEEIVHRSEMAESKWSVDKQRQTNTGVLVGYILTSLEVLDRHSFDRVDSHNGIDNIFNKIFIHNPLKDQSEPFSIDEPVVNLLCEWAVTTNRSGIHRTIVVAKLLEKYQNHLNSEKSSDMDNSDDKDGETNPSSAYSSSSHPPFQNILFNFLDDKAPYLTETSSPECRASFSNLILLFCELIQHEIFSHDVYISTLIARGDLMNATTILPVVQFYHALSAASDCQVKAENSSVKHEQMPDVIKMEVDNEFSIFESKDDAKPSPDQPASVRSLLDQQCHLTSSLPPCIARTPGGPVTPVNLRTSAPHTPSGCGVPTPSSLTPSGNQTPYHAMVHTPGGHVHTPGGSQGVQQHQGGMMGVGNTPTGMMIGHQQPMMDGRSMSLSGMNPYGNPMISPHSQQLHHLQQQQQLHHHQMQLHHQQMQQQQLQQQQLHQQQQYCPTPSPVGPLHHHHFQQTPNPMIPHTPNSNQQLHSSHLAPHGATPTHHQPINQQLISHQLQQPQQQPPQQQQQQQPIQQQQQEPPQNPPTYGKNVRHILYVLHFPVTSGDPCSHENNQRAVVLCGFGRAREDAKHAIKKATKEILRLFCKKNCLDAINGEPNNKVKKKKEKEKSQDTSESAINIEHLFSRFKKLPYHSQHVVTHSVSKNLVDLVSAFASGSSQLLPSVENVSHLFDLMESCFNISHLLSLAVKLLTDIPEVEIQLVNKGSILVGSFTTNLCLCLIGIFRMYHACLLLVQDQTALVFENLCRVVKHVDKPSECSSAERVILAYLYDLYTSCNFLKAKYSEMFGNPCMKVKATIFCEIEPASSNLRWEESFSRELMENPKRKIEQSFVKQLSEVPADRYSFVCSVLYNVCSCHNVDKVNEIANLCAELTACCNVLSSEWLGVLKALCWSSNHNCGFIDVLTQVDVGDLSIHDSLAVFTAILIARHCFSFDDVITQVFLQSLLSACPAVGSGGDPDCDLGARLTCHLLLRLFQMMTPVVGSCGGTNSWVGGSVVGSGGGKNGTTMYIKSSRDRHLIETSHKKVNLSSLVSVLKAILMLGECPTSDSRDSKPGGFVKKSSNILDSLDSPDLSLRTLSRSKSNVENAGLSEYAKYCLKDICQQSWVRESFLKEPEELLTSNLLLDRMLSHKQARHLVHLICHSEGSLGLSLSTPKNRMSDDDDDDDDDDDSDVISSSISRILKNMNQWTLGVSWLELQLMIKQANQVEMGSLLDSIAKGTIDVFQQQNKDKSPKIPQNNNTTQQQQDINDDITNTSNTHDNIWFIAPLISKLSPAVQGRILKTAGSVLETGNNFWSAKSSKDKEKYLQKSTSLLGNQPFLSLVLSCLKGQDEQREGLLKSLNDQLDKFVTNSKEQERISPSDEILLTMLQEALQLRLSLVGSMFDTIQRNNNLVQDWSILLVQLVCCGVVDVQSNSDLLTTVIDMLAVLIHGTLAHDNNDKAEDGKKLYQNLMRKLKKELGEKKSPSIDLLRQVLLIPKVYCEVVVCDPLMTSDSKNQKSNDAEKAQSLQVVRKERISPWEVMENQRNPAPINLSWFGAVRKERKVLKYEEQHRLLLYHSHSIKKPESYFLEPPVLPAEEMEQLPQEKPVELKPIEQMLDAKPETTKAKKTNRGRTNKKQPQSRPTLTQPPHYMQPGGITNPSMTFNRPEMYPSSVPVQNWYNGQPYPTQMTPGGTAGRAYQSGSVPNPRQMLNNVLKTRHPMQQQQQPPQAFIAATGGPAQTQQQNVGWGRQRSGVARGSRLPLDARAAAMFAQQQQQSGQQSTGAQMSAQHFAAQPTQGYPGYASQPMATQMEPNSQGVMNQSYQQQGTSVGYAVQGQGLQGQSYPQASSRYGNMGGAGGGTLPGYGQMIRQPTNQAQSSNFAASAAMQAPHQQQQRLLRQQLLLQQQQQQQQHRQGQQNMTFNNFQ